jgi:hypothetical protein
MKSPMFSVVIPTCNRLDFLKQTLSSVLAQTFMDYELIVVDDGSTDGTVDYLASLRATTKALRQENKGPAAARNLGAHQATGNYIAFLDSDDFWFPWTLSTIHEVIRRYNGPSLISVAAWEFDGEVPNVVQEEVATERFQDYFATASKPGYVGSGTLVIERDVFKRVDGFDENMSVGEDLDLYFRLGTARSFVRVLSPVTLGYRRHAGNMSRLPSSLHCAAMELLKREAQERYPGGRERQKERCKLLSRAVRPVAWSCLRAGLRDEAWQVYRQSFLMSVRLGQFRFLGGFVLTDILALASRVSNQPNSAGVPVRTKCESSND